MAKGNNGVYFYFHFHFHFHVLKGRLRLVLLIVQFSLTICRAKDVCSVCMCPQLHRINRIGITAARRGELEK